jgi:hypothetical protein
MMRNEGQDRFILPFSATAADCSFHSRAAKGLSLMREFGQLGRLFFLITWCCWGWQVPAHAKPARAEANNDPTIREAVRWMRGETQTEREYEFAMTCRFRLLFFWTGKDDVGGGYIKIGRAANDPSLEVIRLLFGSDPEKAHGINRWGAGMEVVKRGNHGNVESSAFFGFMKASKGESVSTMQRELSNEKQGGRHLFEGIISRVDPSRAISTTVPFYADHDFNFRELDSARQVVMDRLEQDQGRKFHVLSGPAVGCERNSGFLSTVLELTDDALAGKGTPIPLCYVYNSKQYTLTLLDARPVPEKTIQFTLSDGRKVDQTYHALEAARFQIENRKTGVRNRFEVLLGTTGDLRGVPIQINYQPNWWFQITLNLKPTMSERAKLP